MSEREKLVRDNVPQLIELLEQRRPKWRVAEQLEYGQLLRNKLCEEAQEVREATSRAAQIEEIVDVLDVVEALMNVLDISKEDIEYIQARKGKISGRFAEKRVLSLVDEG